MKDDSNYSKIFIAFVLIITWLFSWYIFTSEGLGKYFPLVMLLPAILALTLNSVRFRSIKKVFLPITRRLHFKSVLFAILYPILFIMGAAGILFGLGFVTFNEEKLNEIAHFPPLSAILIGLLLMFGEEYGWRGFLLEDLSARYGKIKAAMLVGLVWALWHCPIVYGTALNTQMDNPLALTLIQMGAVFVFSLPFAHAYFLSGNIIPPMIFHFLWNLYNPMFLGNIYRNRQGIFEGDLLWINGEGVTGVLLGSLFFLWMIWTYRRKSALI